MLVSITITLSALAGFTSAASQHKEIRALFNEKYQGFSKLSQEINRLEHQLEKEESSPNCNPIISTRTCKLFSCEIAGQDQKLCAR